MSHTHAQHICHLAKVGDVLYVAQTGAGIRSMLHCIEALQMTGVKVYRTNGQQRVEFPDGNTLRFATIRTLHHARGYSFWHIVTDSHHYLDDPYFRRTLAPCFSTALVGERYSVIG